MKAISRRNPDRLTRANHLIVISTTLLLIGIFHASAQPLTLQNCIDRALIHNLEHRQNRHNLAPARSQLQDARAPFEISYAGTLNLVQRVPYVGQSALTTSTTRQEFTSNRRESFLDYRDDMVLNYSREILAKSSEEIELRQAKLAYTKNVSLYDN